MSESLYLLTICLPLGTILLIFGMRYFAVVQQAKARLANDEASRQIAAALSSIDATLADLKTRLAAVERILKDVE